MQGTRRMLPPSSLVFRDRFANEKAPPVISSRLFQREHFMQTASQGACQQDCLLGKSKRRTLDRYKEHSISYLSFFFIIS